MKALICGSFDPVTLGHMDIIARTASLFDHVVVGVFYNSEKHCLFSPSARAEMIKEACEERGLTNVTVDISEGMVAHYVRDNGIDVIVKGVRNGQDLEYERMIEQANKLAYDKAETMLLMSSPEYSYLSSTVAREFIKHGENIEKIVPDSVIRRLHSERT